MNWFHTFFGNRDGTDPLRDWNTRNLSVGMVSMLMALTGPPVFILQAAASGGYSLEQAVHWMFATFLFGGLFGIFVPLYYRTPIVGAQTITGLAYLTTVTHQFSYNELVGAFIVSGLIIFIVGYFGVFAKLIRYVPREIISAMLAGIIVKFMIDLIVAIEQMIIVGLAALLAFFICLKSLQRIPPMIAAIFVGIVVLFLTQPVEFSEMSLSFSMLTWQSPEFSVVSIIAVSIPLALLILSNDAAVGIAALQQNGYRIDVNRIITLSGVFSMIAAVFGGQSANIAGMMSAICSDQEAGPKEKRYIAPVFAGVMFVFIGIFAWKLLPFVNALPQAFIAMIVGFSLLAVFANSLSIGFSNPSRRMSTAIAFAISASNISVFHISAPVWALLIGTLIARFVEGEPEKKIEEQKAS